MANLEEGSRQQAEIDTVSAAGRRDLIPNPGAFNAFVHGQQISAEVELRTEYLQTYELMRPAIQEVLEAAATKPSGETEHGLKYSALGLRSRAYKIELPDGRTFFMKRNPDRENANKKNIFMTDTNALIKARESGLVPSLVGYNFDDQVMITEFIDRPTALESASQINLGQFIRQRTQDIKKLFNYGLKVDADPSNIFILDDGSVIWADIGLPGMLGKYDESKIVEIHLALLSDTILGIEEVTSRGGMTPKGANELLEKFLETVESSNTLGLVHFFLNYTPTGEN